MSPLLIPQFAIPQFINHIPSLCLCALVAELLPFLQLLENTISLI